MKANSNEKKKYLFIVYNVILHVFYTACTRLFIMVVLDFVPKMDFRMPRIENEDNICCKMSQILWISQVVDFCFQSSVFSFCQRLPFYCQHDLCMD